MLEDSILTVIIRNKDKILYSGQAFAVSTVNDQGPLDILAEHESFISLIKQRVIVRTTPRENREISIDNGILRVYKDKVYVYVNI